MLTFKRKLILTKAQERRIGAWMGTCRMIYNMCKEIQQEAYKNKGVYIHKYELSKQLTEIRNVDWIKSVPRNCLEDAINRLDDSYKRFFKGGGYPKWASKRRFRSILFKENIHVGARGIKLPVIGVLRIVKDSAVTGNVKIVRIKKDPTGYFAYIVTDAVKSIQCQDENQVLGIDMGIKTSLTQQP